MWSQRHVPEISVNCGAQETYGNPEGRHLPHLLVLRNGRAGGLTLTNSEKAGMHQSWIRILVHTIKLMDCEHFNSMSL